MRANQFKLNIVFSFLLILGAFRLLVSDLIPINWDGPIFLDGSYRVYLGQIPNKDFSVPIGPLIFLSGGFGMWVSTQSILGMNLGLILFNLVISLIFIFLLWPDIRKKIEVTDIIFFVVLFLLLFSPKILGGKPFNLAYTGFYNNISYAILMGVMYFLFSSDDCQDKKRNYLLGFIVGILPFIKLTFFLAAALICYFYLSKYRKKQIFSFSIGILVSFALMALTQDGLTFFIKDQMIVSFLRMQENPYFSLDRLWNFFKHTWIDVLIFIVMLCISLKIDYKFFYVGVLLFIAEYFLSMAIMQKPVHFTSTIFALILMKYSIKKSNKLEFLKQLKSNGLYLFLIGKFIINSALWIPFLLINFSMPTFDVVESKLIAKQSVLKNIHNWDFDIYVADCNNACSEIMVVGQNNIYNFYLDLIPSKGKPLYWQKSVTFSKDLIEDENFFAKNQMLSGVSRVILSKGFHYESSVEFIRIYDELLRKNFTLKLENEQVIVFHKKD